MTKVLLLLALLSSQAHALHSPFYDEDIPGLRLEDSDPEPTAEYNGPYEEGYNDNSYYQTQASYPSLGMSYEIRADEELAEENLD